jgi:hypothetical protein
MSRTRRPPGRRRAIAGSTLALAGLWIGTGAAVALAHWTRPAATVRLEVTAGTVEFTLADASPRLLLRTTPVASVTVAGFRSLHPGAAGGRAREPRAVEPPDSGASVSFEPAVLEAVSAGARARVRLNRVADEPFTRITISRAARGAVRLEPGATVRCHRCGEFGVALLGLGPDSTAPTTLDWQGRDDGGGTDLLVETAGPLALSDDDLRVAGAFETREAADGQFVSTVRDASVQMLDIGRTVPLGSGVRLNVGGIQPGTGLLKRIEAGEGGVSAVLEAKVHTLSVERAGQTTTLLPSYLERGFHSQWWLYLAQGVVLVGGTLTKILRALAGGRET